MNEVEDLLRRFKPVKAPEHLGHPLPRHAAPPVEHFRYSGWIPTLAAGMALFAILFYAVKSVPLPSPAPYASSQDEYSEWTYWSSCKIGSRVKYTMNGEVAGVKSKLTVTRELLEIGTDKVTLKTNFTGFIGPDETVRTKDRTETIPKEKRILILKELGQEEIDVNGKTLKCRVVTGQGFDGEEDKPKKIWISSEVPGGLVQLEANSEEKKTASKMTLIEYERK
jgi:hypothetical protein